MRDADGAELMKRLRSKPKKEPKTATLAEGTLPLDHVAIIMDGNRRWAQNRSLPGAIGHKQGVASLKKIVRHAGERGLKFLTVYAFSSENWQRSADEVAYLLKLFSQTLDGEFDELSGNNVRLRFIGDLDAMPAELKRSMRQSMDDSKDNSGLNLQVAINYGSRLELTSAVKRLAERVKTGELDPSEIDEEMISANLYTGGIPDPEMLIRTGGEQRLSNYLLWQSAYTELYVTPKLWPDFTPDDFDVAVREFSGRDRRYGGD